MVDDESGGRLLDSGAVGHHDRDALAGAGIENGEGHESLLFRPILPKAGNGVRDCRHKTRRRVRACSLTHAQSSETE